MRTHTCGELTKGTVGSEATLCGWVDTVRDHGGVIFADLRDRYGRTQAVFHPETDAGLHARAQNLRSEAVVRVTGIVRERPEGTVNPRLPTGEIELDVRSLEILSVPGDLPFLPSEAEGTNEELRLKHRYLDLRREEMQRRLSVRHRAFHAARTFLDAEAFLEVETPYLYKSTPEGAREFLVPSRTAPGSFYALPQSPQVFKQILMVAGVDRYFQIVRCFRDEDLRADRQPEFTQLDIETSFMTMDGLLDLLERLTAAVFEKGTGVTLERPFLRIPYAEAMARYGTDKPDLRIPIEIVDISEIVKRTSFKVFLDALASDGTVRALRIPGGAAMSRKELDALPKEVVDYGAKGVAWVKVGADGLSGPVAKFLDGEPGEALLAATGATDGDLILFGAGPERVVAPSLGHLRVKIGRERCMAPDAPHRLCWVTEFPWCERDPDTGEVVAMHHPFTAPHPDDVEKMESDPLAVRAQAYDLVCDGLEIAGGSIRIHEPELQDRVFRALDLAPERIEAKFGFLLRALRSGAPPHGGIAYGFDRLVAILCGVPNIREVIAFPKTHRGQCPLSGAPSPVDPEQLAALHIRTEAPAAEAP